MSGKPGSPRVLHVHGSLAAGSRLAERSVRVIQGFGGRLRHTLVSGDGTWDALDVIADGVPVERREDFPGLRGIPWPGRLQAIARAMVDYNLVLTYGRGGILAALAHTSFKDLLHLPPLIHHEDGSDETPRERRGLRSTWYRRVGLGKAAGLVVPTELMEADALVRWQQPLGRVKTIRDGFDLDRLKQPAKADAIPRLLKRRGEYWIVCSTRLDDHRGLTPFLDAMREIDDTWHLVVAGEGSGRAALEAEASSRGLDNRLHIVPPLADVSTLTRLADIVAVPAGNDPLPFEALLALGAGKPVIGVETGEMGTAVAPENASFICRPGDGASLSLALQQLTDNEVLRTQIGAANRERAVAEHDQKAMLGAYRRLYASAMGIETI